MNGNSSANDIANKTLVGWIDGGTDRGTLDILYASCVTIILCIWVSTYPNVPAPSDRWYHRIVDKANLAAIGALSPDLLFALALGQYSSAKRSIKAFKTEWPDRPWTITHAFYADMGGFRITSDRDSYSIPVNSRQLLYLIKYKHVAFPSITKEALTEMSSGDAFSKIIVIWQVVWFVITTITRLANGLPITTLEVTAFIYAVMMVATSMAWFQKPQITVSTFLPLVSGISFEDVRQCAQQTTHPAMTDWHETPFDFIWKRGALKIDKDWQFASRLSHQLCIPLFTRLPGRPWVRMPSDIWIQPKVAVAVPATVLQIPFSLSFLWAWDFHFASKAEQILWRSSAVFHAVYIWFITLHYMYYLRKPPTAQASNALPQSKTITQPPKDEFQVGKSPHRIPNHHSRKEDSRLNRIKRHIARWRNTTPTQDPDHHMSLRWSCCILTLTLLYSLAHIFIGIEDFISLRSQPADIYRTPGEYFPLIN